MPAKIERVIVLEDAFAAGGKPVADLLRTLLEFMSDDLPAMAHGKIAPDGFDPWREAFRVVQAYETWQTFGAFVAQHKPKIGPGVRERMEFASTVTAAQAEAGRAVLRQGPRACARRSRCPAPCWRCRPRPPSRRRSTRRRPSSTISARA